MAPAPSSPPAATPSGHSDDQKAVDVGVGVGVGLGLPVVGLLVFGAHYGLARRQRQAKMQQGAPEKKQDSPSGAAPAAAAEGDEPLQQ